MSRFLPRPALRLLGGVWLTTLALGVQAVDSAPTGTVKGRAPVASSVAISNQSNPGIGLRQGNTAAGSYSFSDADGDTESGTTRQWLRDGAAISGATAATYVTQAADVGHQLSVRITPATSAAITDPSSGTPITSVAQSVVAAGAAVAVGNFLAPTTTLRNWSTANSYCNGLGSGARLPTQAELQQLYIDATSATAAGQFNSEMCTSYGWPLASMCGGGSSSSRYWSSTPYSAGNHYLVNLSNGYGYVNIDSDTFSVACVR